MENAHGALPGEAVREGGSIPWQRHCWCLQTERRVPRRGEKLPEGVALSAFPCSCVLSQNAPVPGYHWVTLVSVIVKGTRARKGSAAIHIPDGSLLLSEFCNIPNVGRASPHL